MNQYDEALKKETAFLGQPRGRLSENQDEFSSELN